MKEWNLFKGDDWKNKVDVKDFILNNYIEYVGDDSFLESISSKTDTLWGKCQNLIKEELKKGVLDIETNIMSGVDQYNPGYIDKENEVIFGLQTDEPLKRIVNPYGGIRMVENALKSYNYKISDEINNFSKYRKTHNDGVFDAYTKDIRLARSSHLITGLPDAYGRGRIIGDYRRISLYGVDFLIDEKEKDLKEY